MKAEASLRRAQPWLGTLVEIEVPAWQAGLIDGAFQKIADVHHAMSFHSETSDLAKLRRAQINEIVSVDPNTVRVLRAAVELYHLTEGLFDVTIATQLVEWGYLPSPVSGDVGASEATSANIEIVDDTHVKLTKPLLIDLGGIAKGFAVDEAVEFLQENGAETGIVNAGGDLRVFGKKIYPITIRAADHSAPVEQITLQDGAMATSANLANRKRVGSRVRAPHVTKDREAALHSDSVSVFAPLAMHADALTKVAISDAALASRVALMFNAEVSFSSVA